MSSKIFHLVLLVLLFLSFCSLSLGSFFFVSKTSWSLKSSSHKQLYHYHHHYHQHHHHDQVLKQKQLLKNTALFVASSKTSNNNKSQQEDERLKHRVTLDSGRSVMALSRTVPITKTWNITIFEWDKPAQVVEDYWEEVAATAAASFESISSKTLNNSNKDDDDNNEKHQSSSSPLDPFGLVCWPGAVVASQQLLQHQHDVIQNATVLILGSGCGIEAQACAYLGAKKVIATDNNPATQKLLQLGAQYANLQSIIETRIFDLFSTETIPKSDVVVVADVLYNDRLASQVAKRCTEAVLRYPNVKILVSDSQRYVDFITKLNQNLQQQQISINNKQQSTAANTNQHLHHSEISWTDAHIDLFTGSGVIIDEDQTYEVNARYLWVGLPAAIDS